MRFTNNTGCIVGLIVALVFAIVALIALVIIINTIKSFDYKAAAEDLKNGIQEFNSTLRSINPTTVPTT